MFVRRIDGAVSRTVRGLARDTQFARQMRGLLDAGLDLMGRGAGFLVSLRGHSDTRVRWLELRNKIAAYLRFEGRHYMGREAICGLDPYSRLFAAEGYVYRNVRLGSFVPDLPLELSPIAIHAGVGLRLAEQALASIDAGESESQVLNEFSAVCRRNSFEGFGGIMEEALGLVTRTMYPHLLEKLDECLRAMNTESWERFWHGVGRGIYFAPSNILPFRAVPWSGVCMCLSEPPHETGKRNALSGFSFALTLVNLRHLEVLEAFFEHHAAQALDCIDGLEAAMTVWTLSNGGSKSQEQPSTPSTARLLWPCHVADEDRRRPERLFSAPLRGPCASMEQVSQMVRASAGGA